MPSPRATEALAATEHPEGMSQPMATRIDRQSRCHDTTLCTRTAPHWPEDARTPARLMATHGRQAHPVNRLASVRPSAPSGGTRR
jgi:hypothetical protein